MAWMNEALQKEHTPAHIASQVVSVYAHDV
jgi:hypothetical protein